MVRNKRLTPGVFIDRVKQELFLHTQAEKINAIFELSIQQNGLLSDQPQRITLYLSLLRNRNRKFDSRCTGILTTCIFACLQTKHRNVDIPFSSSSV